MVNDCDPRVTQNAKDIDMLKEDSKQNKVTHEKLFERIEKLSLQQGISDERLSNIFGMLTEIKNDVCRLTEQPSKRWELVASALITGVVAIVIAVLFKGGF